MKRAKHLAANQRDMFLREGVETKTEQKIQKSDLDPSSDSLTYVSRAYVIQLNENIWDFFASFFLHLTFVNYS